jgi:hypothetical protein
MGVMTHAHNFDVEDRRTTIQGHPGQKHKTLTEKQTERKRT